MSLHPNYDYVGAVEAPARERGGVMIEVDYLSNEIAEAKSVFHALAARLEVVRRPQVAEDRSATEVAHPVPRCELASHVMAATREVMDLTRAMRALLEELAL